MIHIANTACTSTNDVFDRAVRVAEHYGFSHLDTVPPAPGDNTSTAAITTRNVATSSREERALVPFAKTCVARGLCSPASPTFLWRHTVQSRGNAGKQLALELHVLGVPTAVAEALLITVANAIAHDVGIQERIVCINGIGSEESSARFLRELSSYLSKHAAKIGPLSARAHEDPIATLLSLAERGHPVALRAPQTMEFLNEEERRHLWDILEYLEIADAYYELNPYVLGSRECWNHALFEICSIDADTQALTPFARGGRYDTLLARAGGSDGSGASITILTEVRGVRAPKVPRVQKAAAPNVYFAHLGAEAKRRSIPLIETLRRAGIRVHQSLAHDQIADQMEAAKRLEVPYALVMGHKEAVESNIIVRDMRTYAQTAVPLPELPGYLKRRKIGVVRA